MPVALCRPIPTSFYLLYQHLRESEIAVSYYIPILAMVLIAALFVLLSIGASIIIGPHRCQQRRMMSTSAVDALIALKTAVVCPQVLQLSP